MVSSSSAFDVDFSYLETRQGDEPHRQAYVSGCSMEFPRELAVGQVVSLSSFGRGHDCQTCASCPQGQRAEFSMPIFFIWLRSLQWSVYSRNIIVCS